MAGVDQGMEFQLAGRVRLQQPDPPSARDPALDALHLRQFSRQHQEPESPSASGDLWTAFFRRDGRSLVAGDAAERGGCGGPCTGPPALTAGIGPAKAGPYIRWLFRTGLRASKQRVPVHDLDVSRISGRGLRSRLQGRLYIAERSTFLHHRYHFVACFRCALQTLLEPWSRECVSFTVAVHKQIRGERDDLVYCRYPSVSRCALVL